MKLRDARPKENPTKLLVVGLLCSKQENPWQSRSASSVRCGTGGVKG
jgi:hypothetical protein